MTAEKNSTNLISSSMGVPPHSVASSEDSSKVHSEPSKDVIPKPVITMPEAGTDDTNTEVQQRSNSSRK